LKITILIIIIIIYSYNISSILLISTKPSSDMIQRNTKTRRRRRVFCFFSIPYRAVRFFNVLSPDALPSGRLQRQRLLRQRDSENGDSNCVKELAGSAAAAEKHRSKQRSPGLYLNVLNSTCVDSGRHTRDLGRLLAARFRYDRCGCRDDFLIFSLSPGFRPSGPACSPCRSPEAAAGDG